MRHRKALEALAVVVVMVGCAPFPDLTFASSDAGGSSPPDATLSDVDSAAGADDGGADPDSAPMDIVDDASDDAPNAVATIRCRTGTVSTCAKCNGLRLRCKNGPRDECVSDCSTCETVGTYWFPCLHCPTAGAIPRGQCLPVGKNGQVACAEKQLCSCTADTNCTTVPNSAATCDVLSGANVCLPCGAPGTDGAACVSASGVAGLCHIKAGLPPQCD
jgi:hypothetical protein